MTEPTTDRPTDTIRDAFEAMLWFLACLIGPLRPRKITPAEEIGALAACEVETDFEPDEPPAPLLALRDLVTRAAEHNRRAGAGGNWTPERHRETRERCERATPGPWEAANLFGKLSIVRPERRFDPQGAIAGHYGVGEHDAAFIAHAREDLPAALREIERLTAELAAHAPADASLEEKKVSPIEFVAREFDRAAFMQERGFIDHDRGDCYRDAAKRMRAVDASRPGGTMSPDWIRGVRAAADVAASYNRDSTHPYRLDDCILAKLNVGGEPRANEHASRPGLTEEQARAIVDDLNEAGDSPTVLVSAAAVRAMLDSRPASAVAKPDDRTLTEEQIDNVLRVALDVGKWDRPQGERMLRRFLRASRGETGPAPTWGEQAIAEHRRAADGITRVRVIEPPASPFGEWPEPERSGLTCPGCYAATGIATPCKGPLLSPAEQADPSFADALLVAQDRHREAAAVHPTTETDRQRSTLHAGDPAAVQYCACGAAVSPGEDHPTGPRHDVARRPQ